MSTDSATTLTTPTASGEASIAGASAGLWPIETQSSRLGQSEAQPQQGEPAETEAAPQPASVEAELVRFRLFAEAALDTIDSLVLKLDPQGNILDMNQACRRATGFKPAEVRNQPLVNVLAIPREVDLIQEKLREVKRAPTGGASDQGLGAGADEFGAGQAGDPSSLVPSTQPLAPSPPDGVLRFESELLTKAGQQRPVAWSLKALRDLAGSVVYLLLTGTDRSEGVDDSRSEIPSDAVSSNRDVPTPNPQSPSPTPPPAAKASDCSLFPSRRTPTGVVKDLRTSPRLAFRCHQRIAPIFGGVLPGVDDFFEVECADLSQGGISFRLNRPPDFETLVIALGKPPQHSYVSARVVRCTTTERDGGEAYLVGCRFTGKVSL